MKPVVLCILDGCGIREEKDGNAFANANKPNFDYLWNNYPHCYLEASGEFVGIPKGQMGNSEVGHQNIGAGQVIYQSLLRISNDISSGNFYSNEAFLGAINNCKAKGTNLHLIGLMSDGGIHSHIDHLFALLDLCKRENFDRVYIHPLLDGRDTEPMVAPKYIEMLKQKIAQIGVGEIVTIAGRYYTMNRDRNWELTALGYNAIINGDGVFNVKSTEEAFEQEYSENLTDEFMKPTVLKKVPILANDSIIMFNFRSDRMIQLLRALKMKDFADFNRSRGYIPLYLVTMTEYEVNQEYENVHVAYKPIEITNTLGEYISNLGMKQLRLSEFEKSSHVTFHFNGCRDVVFPLEDIKIFDRQNVFTYDEMPQMRSTEITDYLLKSINDYDLIVLNYPNGDALGHTGIYDKTVEGVECIDKCLGRIINESNLEAYTLVITADHGNCEIMIDPDGTPNKMHSTSLVPFIVVDKNINIDSNVIGKLADISPTILDIMGIDIPKEMTGRSLIK